MIKDHVISVDGIEVKGYAHEVWGGFVWITEDGRELRYTKARTRDACELAVEAACIRLGIYEAFA